MAAGLDTPRLPRQLARLAWHVKFQRQPARLAALTALRQQQWLPLEAVEALQGAKLRALVHHAYANVPYYHRVMDERGVRPEHIRAAADLTLLPLLTKDVIREQSSALRAGRGVASPELVRANHTGGSTGTPLTFYQDQTYRDWGDMELHRDYELCGYRLGDPIAFLWGSDYDARVHRTPQGRLRNVLENRLFLDAFDSTEDDLVAFAAQLRRFRPRLLVGYVSSLVLLARVIATHGLRGVRPAALQSSAETLTADQRQLLEATFGCPVFNRYGCREVGNVAHECAAHRGLHLLADTNLTELIRDGQPAAPGEEGQVVATNLHNYAMPFLRYVTGDVAVAGDGTPCPCGRGLPLVQAVVGRSADIIVAPSGKLLHGEFFTHLFYTLPSVKEFQVVQRDATRLDVTIVPAGEWDHLAVTRYLRDVIAQHGDPAFDVRVTVRERIPRSASGKFRFTICEVPHRLAISTGARQ